MLAHIDYSLSEYLTNKDLNTAFLFILKENVDLDLVKIELEKMYYTNELTLWLNSDLFLVCTCKLDFNTKKVILSSIASSATGYNKEVMGDVFHTVYTGFKELSGVSTEVAEESVDVSDIAIYKMYTIHSGTDIHVQKSNNSISPILDNTSIIAALSTNPRASKTDYNAHSGLDIRDMPKIQYSYQNNIKEGLPDSSKQTYMFLIGKGYFDSYGNKWGDQGRVIVDLGEPKDVDRFLFDTYEYSRTKDGELPSAYYNSYIDLFYKDEISGEWVLAVSKYCRTKTYTSVGSIPYTRQVATFPKIKARYWLVSGHGIYYTDYYNRGYNSEFYVSSIGLGLSDTPKVPAPIKTDFKAVLSFSSALMTSIKDFRFDSYDEVVSSSNRGNVRNSMILDVVMDSDTEENKANADLILTSPLEAGKICTL